MSVASKGLFIVIEGVDGAGKSTQYDLMRQKLKNEGYDVEEIHFPRYDEPSSYFVREYLKGNYGTAEEVGPYTGSVFYALDRYQAASQIQNALDQGKIVLCDRYTGSNMAHQGTKFNHAEERRGYFIWLDNLEFQMLKIPRPDHNFVLTAPLEVIQERLAAKTNSSTHVQGKDIHEADPEHIRKSREVYIDLCNLFPKDFHQIEGARSGKVMPVEVIHDLMWKSIESLLPEKPAKTKGSTVPEKPNIQSENPYVTRTDEGWDISEAGKQYLEEAVTNSEGNVYAFTDKLGALTIAAAMARLSRRGDDMRVTILDEFAPHEGKDVKLLERVITAYGDDSVQQLVGQHVVVEGASNLLTKHLEWGRLGSYLEQSTRYIYFDEKDRDGKYKYYTPDHFNDATKQLYEQSIDRIFDAYSSMVHNLSDYLAKNSTVPKSEQDGAWRSAIRAQACDAIRPVLPVATKSTVGIFASGQALEMMIMRLRASDSKEAQITGNQVLEEARKVIPVFLERADKPDRGGAATAYQANTRHSVGELADTYLPDTYGETTEPVSLRGFWPKNELDLVPHMLYEHSNMSLNEITEAVDSWPIEQRDEVFKAYMGERLNRRHKPGRALEQAHYTWDLVCDYGIFRDLQRHRMVDDLQWQPLTPRYGFETPAIVEEADLGELFASCFDLSAELYSLLQKAGYQYEAQYATLLGHKMRWKVTYNAREAFHLHELRTSPQGHPGYRKLVAQMHEELTNVHPQLGEAMRFVNKGEDEELTRLAAERYTQFKLDKLT
ncbi:FAD-dependent thymidylate synthase [Candidatus Saccharibacteria bacterium]|nr:FAD-dependent thymidylate synthase [Candidatus Saccharibacteria bacterium]